MRISIFVKRIRELFQTVETRTKNQANMRAKFGTQLTRFCASGECGWNFSLGPSSPAQAAVIPQSSMHSLHLVNHSLRIRQFNVEWETFEVCDSSLDGKSDTSQAWISTFVELKHHDVNWIDQYQCPRVAEKKEARGANLGDSNQTLTLELSH
jgi:hypothetical protein